FATAIPTLAAASSGEAATGLPKEPENPIAHRRGHVSQVRSPRFQLSVHLPPEFRAIARRSFASGSFVSLRRGRRAPASPAALQAERRELLFRQLGETREQIDFMLGKPEGAA